MKENFKTALDFVMKHECVFAAGHYGDYSRVITENVSGDRGGLTKYGIDQRSHPHINIRALDYAGAQQIYRNGEWTKCRCDELPSGFDAAVFNAAVNCGAGTAVLLLQRACNDEGTQPALKEDAFIGPKTIAACGRTPRALFRFIVLLGDHYRDLADANPRNQKFLKGWLNRTDDLEASLGRFIPSKPEARGASLA